VAGRARSLVVEADGGSRGNPGIAGWGALVRDAESGRVLWEGAAPLGTASNNVAEYSGLVAGLKAAQRIARGAEITLVERHFRAADQARRAPGVAGTVGALEPAVAGGEVAQLMRGTRRQQRRDAGYRPRLEGERRLALGATVATLVVGLQCPRQRRVRALPAAARAIGANRARQR